LIQEFFLEKANKSVLENELNQHWMEFEVGEELKNGNLANLRNRVQHKIYLEENQKLRKLQPLQRLQRIAAILFVPLLLGFAAYFISSKLNTAPPAYAEIICPEGTRTRFTLPDGSSGFLNNGSRLKYVVPFHTSREVALVGEAFFDVKQNGTPFRVRTKKLDIAVTGTTFNVIAYEDDPTEEVILQTGEVIISSAKGNKLSTLHPNQQLTFNLQDHQYQVRNVDASQFTAWRQGKLVFRNERLEAVAKRIERWYNVTIEIEDEALKGYTYHATFIDHSLEEVLRLLTLTSPMKFEIENKNQNTAGEYLKKKKVILKIDR
jgi:ferric-dicitrate binding protein FerR (iron transport regulator)